MRKNRAPGKLFVRKRGRRGVAIILTLAIMSLLLILAMGFLFNSSTGKLSANVNADIVRARLLADSGLKRFVAAIERDISSLPGSEYNPGVSFYEPTVGAWAGRRYMATVNTGGDLVEGSTDSPLYAKIAGIDFTPSSLVSGADVTLSGNVRWVNVTTLKETTASPNSGAGTDSEVRTIGRYAFIGIDETGKVSPGAALANTTSETAGEDTGVNYDELYLGNAFVSSTPTVAEFATKATNVSGRPIWDSWHHILKRNITGLSTTDAFKALFPHSREIEAFHHATDTTTRHRYNLQNAGTDNVTKLTSAAALFSANNNGGIQWLSSNDSVAQHVAMNIIDYSDTNNTATTDGSLWSATAPSSVPAVMGCEKVPYLNELKIDIEMPGSPGAATVTFAFELVNLYDAAFTSASVIEIEADYRATSGVAAGTLEAALTMATPTFGARGYTITGTVSDTMNVTAALVGFEITQVRMRFAGSAAPLNEWWDAALIETATATQDISLFPATPPALDRVEIYAGVNDPRVNHLSSQWTWTDWEEFGTAPAGATFATPYKNSQISSAGGDLEDSGFMDAGTASNQLGGYSTAYIRNGPMQSLWELGAIHRGTPWATLNLSAFSDASTEIGPGNYGTGDANILDHVKLSDDTVVEGKFNANSKYELAWRCLLGHIELGDSFVDASTGSAAFDKGTNAATWLTSSGREVLIDGGDGVMDNNGNWVNRGQIADVVNMTDATFTGSAYTTDAAKEELVGKLANLLTTRSNWFSVVVCAQVINPELYNLPPPYQQVKVLAEHKMLAVVYRDAFTNEMRVEHVQPLDE